MKKPKRTLNIVKLGRYLPFEQKIQKRKFFRGNLKIYFLGGSGQKKPERIKTIQKLGYYLAFKQKKTILKFFWEKT